MEVLSIVENLFREYGYLVLLIGLPLDAIAFPIPPGNTTLTYAGYLAYREILAWFPALTLGWIGSMIGITITYWIGYRWGAELIERFGVWLSIKPKHIEKTRFYYNRYGNYLLLISFFIPGLRQVIGYCIGILRIPFITFMLYAYIGVGLWVGTFFSIGFLFGGQWQQVFLLFARYVEYFLIAGGCLLIGWIGLKFWRLGKGGSPS